MSVILADADKACIWIQTFIQTLVCIRLHRRMYKNVIFVILRLKYTFQIIAVNAKRTPAY